MPMNLALSAVNGDVANWFVVCMGVGTVFVGLISIIIICAVIGLFCRKGSRKQETAAVTAAPAASEVIENRQEIIAAIAAVAAEELGTDISAIRIHSLKKL